MKFQRKPEGKRFKGFAAAIFAAMVVAAFAFITSAIMTQNSGFQNNQLQARLAAERFEDAMDFANATQEDAIVDSAYAVYGCTPTSNDFCTEYESLLLDDYIHAMEALNDSVVTASFSVVSTTCVLTSFQLGRAEYDVTLNGLLNASTQNAFKTQFVSIPKHVITGKTFEFDRWGFFVETGGSEKNKFTHTC